MPKNSIITEPAPKHWRAFESAVFTRQIEISARRGAVCMHRTWTVLPAWNFSIGIAALGQYEDVHCLFNPMTSNKITDHSFC